MCNLLDYVVCSNKILLFYVLSSVVLWNSKSRFNSCSSTELCRGRNWTCPGKIFWWTQQNITAILLLFTYCVNNNFIILICYLTNFDMLLFCLRIYVHTRKTNIKVLFSNCYSECFCYLNCISEHLKRLSSEWVSILTSNIWQDSGYFSSGFCCWLRSLWVLFHKKVQEKNIACKEYTSNTA